QTGEMKFNPKQIDVLSLLRENIELIKRRIDDKEIKLTIDVPENTLALADENMVKTIIRNLLSNAVKFTPEGGKIAISSYSDKDFVYCEVTDNGIGISNDDLQKLFKIDQHYTRLGLSNEKGSGLGLILCKEFVEKNGGNIEVISKLDKGTTIKFSLQKLNS
ncbi:MAG TPA: HAMP domain-containing sensor histidine kinase, partial [Bacteroidales bacterium]|nr:HAMP domain-containing sensor histidine kinase [Bacteroidales bacterium]